MSFKDLTAKKVKQITSNFYENQNKVNPIDLEIEKIETYWEYYLASAIVNRAGNGFSSIVIDSNDVEQETIPVAIIFPTNLELFIDFLKNKGFKVYNMQVCSSIKYLVISWDKEDTNAYFSKDMKSSKTVVEDIEYTDPIYCEHANENPTDCPCPDNCYCKQYTCKNK